MGSHWRARRLAELARTAIPEGDRLQGHTYATLPRAAAFGAVCGMSKSSVLETDSDGHVMKPSAVWDSAVGQFDRVPGHPEQSPAFGIEKERQQDRNSQCAAGAA